MSGDGNGHVRVGNGNGHVRAGDGNGHVGEGDGRARAGDGNGHVGVGDGNGHVRVGDGNGHVRVGDGPQSGDREPSGAGPGGGRGSGEDHGGGRGDGSGDDRGGGDDDDARLPPWLRPGPAALIALGLLAVGSFGWTAATWRVGEGTSVPCGSFTPNPSVWHTPVNVDADAGRADPRRVSWAAALRETRGTVECAELVGRSPEDLEVLLGAPTDTRETDGGRALGLRDDEQAWSFTRPDGSSAQVTAVIVRFADGGAGAAVSRRAFSGRG